MDELLSEVEADKEETLTKFEFMNHVYKYKSMMKPLFSYQVWIIYLYTVYIFMLPIIENFAR